MASGQPDVLGTILASRGGPDALEGHHSLLQRELAMRPVQRVHATDVVDAVVDALDTLAERLRLS